MLPLLTWSHVFAICGLLAGLGTAADLLLTDKVLRKLHDLLLSWWNSLDDTRIPDMPRLMANTTLRLFGAVCGSRIRSLRCLAVLVPLSAFLTFVSITSAFVIHADPGEQFSLSDILSFTWMNLSARGGLGPIPWVLAAVNLPFNILTVVITIGILQRLAEASQVKRAVLIVVDIASTYALACVCLFVVLLFIGPHDLDLPDFNVWLYVGRAVYLTSAALAFTRTGIPFGLMLGLFALTMFIPTAAYLLILCLMVMAKGILSGVRWVAMYVCELSTERAEKCTVFLVFAMILNTAVLIIKTVLSIVMCTLPTS